MRRTKDENKTRLEKESNVNLLLNQWLAYGEIEENLKLVYGLMKELIKERVY